MKDFAIRAWSNYYVRAGALAGVFEVAAGPGGGKRTGAALVAAPFVMLAGSPAVRAMATRQWQKMKEAMRPK